MDCEREINVHGACEGVVCGVVNQLEGLIELVVVVNEDLLDLDQQSAEWLWIYSTAYRHDRPKDLFNHGHRLWIFRQHDSGLDEVALRIVACSTNQDLATSFLRFLDVSHDLVKSGLAAVWRVR